MWFMEEVKECVEKGGDEMREFKERVRSRVIYKWMKGEKGKRYYEGGV